MTLLAASIMVESLESAMRQAILAAEHGADLIEYRLDRFTDHPSAAQDLVRQSPLPCLATCRPTWEGGDYDGDEQTRLSFLEHVGLAQPAYIDLELAAFDRSANIRQKIQLVVDHPDQPRPTPTGLVLSSHDFQSRPLDLLQRIEAMTHAPACRVVKIAWRARSLRDNVEAFEILQSRQKPTIALCMGPFGLMSRILAKKFGGLLTFAGVDDQSVTAPGQVGLQTLKTRYRWDAIHTDTAVYGIIGDPIEHSLSPHIHNAGFDHVAHDAVYVPMPISSGYESFKATVGELLAFGPLNFRGASVTIPHKQNLIRFVRESGGRIEPLAEAIGAANTLRVEDDGTLYACNTDYSAAIDSIIEALRITREQLTGRRVAIIGAGGVARAIVTALTHHGATVVIYNRTLENAQQLSDQINALEPAAGKVVVAPMENLCKSCCDIYVNCTPIGMFPRTDATPMPDLPNMTTETLVFDTIYNPLQTRLLREARQAGAKIINGLPMFVHQAARQFELWTGQPAPVEKFEKIVTDLLPS